MYFSVACFVFALHVAPTSCVKNPFKCLNGINCFSRQIAPEPFSVLEFDVDVGIPFLTAATEWLKKSGGLQFKGIYRVGPKCGCTGSDNNLREVLFHFKENPTDRTMPTTLAHQAKSGCMDNTKHGITYITSLIKSFVQQIKGTAIPMSATNLKRVKKNETCYKVQTIVNSIAEDTRSVLKILFEHMHDIVNNNDVNLMNAANLGTMIGPNLFPFNQNNAAKELLLNDLKVGIAAMFIDHPQLIHNPPENYCYTMPDPQPITPDSGNPEAPEEECNNEETDQQNDRLLQVDVHHPGDAFGSSDSISPQRDSSLDFHQPDPHRRGHSFHGSPISGQDDIPGGIQSKPVVRSQSTSDRFHPAEPYDASGVHQSKPVGRTQSTSHNLNPRLGSHQTDYASKSRGRSHSLQAPHTSEQFDASGVNSHSKSVLGSQPTGPGSKQESLVAEDDRSIHSEQDETRDSLKALPSTARHESSVADGGRSIHSEQDKRRGYLKTLPAMKTNAVKEEINRLNKLHKQH